MGLLNWLHKLIRARALIKTMAPKLFIQHKDGTYAPVDRNRMWQVGDEEVPEWELVNRINQTIHEEEE